MKTIKCKICGNKLNKYEIEHGFNEICRVCWLIEKVMVNANNIEDVQQGFDDFIKGNGDI